jgi:hypothetical protein
MNSHAPEELAVPSSLSSANNNTTIYEKHTLYYRYRYINDSHHALIDLSGITIASENLIC